MDFRKIKRSAKNNADYNEINSKKIRIDVEPEEKLGAYQSDTFEVKNIITDPFVHEKSQIWTKVWILLERFRINSGKQATARLRQHKQHNYTIKTN